MMKRVMTKSTIVLVSLLIPFFSTQSVASDFNPPPWRGSPGSTYQRWSFSTSDTFPIADGYNNPYGTPNVIDIINGIWVDQRGGQQGIWDAQSINFCVPNDTTSLADTKYRVEMIWDVQATAYPTLHLYVGDILNTSPAAEAAIVEDNYIPNSSRWKYTIFEITTQAFASTPVIYFEAEFVHLSIVVPIYVDEVIIDTILIPEPATLCLTGIGFLLLKKRRAS